MRGRRAFIGGGVALLGAAALPSASSGASRETSDGFAYSRRLPTKVDVDVFVAGGGPAGVAAAVSAARAGAKVFVAEAHTCFGGMSTAGHIPLFMQHSDGVRDMDVGFGQEVRAKLAKERHLIGPATDIEALKRVYDELIVSTGADFLFQTRVVDVIVRDGSVERVVCAAPSGLWSVKAKVWIDATGNGDLCTFAGAESQTGDEKGVSMPATLCSLWTGIDWKRTAKDPEWVSQVSELARANAEGVFSQPEPPQSWAAIWEVGDDVGNGNLGHEFNLDGTDERSLSKAYVAGRKRVLEYERYLRDYLKHGFENARVVSTADLMGVRASRRIVGDYVLVKEDFARRATFEDEIGRFCYRIDVHSASLDAAAVAADMRKYDYSFKKGESYGIPYRSLIPKTLRNVLVAGRCISCDHYMQGSIRVTPGCWITGQAAGRAAAAAVRKNGDVRAVDVREVVKEIRPC